MIVIIVIHLMIVLAMVGVVLLQKSEGGGLVSSTSGFMTGRGTANVLTRTTALLAVGFFLTSLAIINTGGAPATQQTPGTAPLSSGGHGVLDQLRGNAAAPAPGPAPSGPQVPQSQ
jgi:preprotein translocase subunit SecG